MGPCTCAFIIIVKRIAPTLCLFILRLSVRPLLGLVGKASSSPINFTQSLWCGCHLPIIGVFKFYKVSCPTPWPFGKILRAT